MATRADAKTRKPVGYGDVEQGLTTLYEPSDRSKITVDIVAVPGLGANPLQSWRSVDPNDDFNWLEHKTGLQSLFPTARVLLYNFGSAWFGSIKVDQTLRNLGMTLLSSLKDVRENDSKDGTSKDGHSRRPIVFLGHCMGGLVVAKAICLSVERRDRFPSMFEATAGCMFFATPFEGAPVASGAFMLAGALEKFGQPAIRSKLLEALAPGGTEIKDLKADFVRHASKLSQRIEIVCFYEQHPTDIPGMLKKGLLHSALGVFLGNQREQIIVSKDSASLVIGDSNNLSLAKNHREVVKFRDSQDPNFQIVRDHLKFLIHGAFRVVRNRFNSVRDVDRKMVKDVLDTLEGARVEHKRKKLAQAIKPDSWVQKEQRFIEWCKPGESMTDFLWIRASEGRGKTGASLSIVNAMKKKLEADEVASDTAPNVLAFYFCDVFDGSNTAEEVLKTLISQIIEQQETLAPYAKALLRKSGSDENLTLSIENLWRTFQDILADEYVGTIYFVLNNLHVLPEEAPSTRKLWDYIYQEVLFAKENYQDRRVKTRWFITSQKRHLIGRALGEERVKVIDLDDPKYQNQVQQELKRHAKMRISQLGLEKHYSRALTYFAGTLVGSRAENIKWIDITCVQLQALSADSTDLPVRRLLEQIPQDVKTMLNRSWLQVLSKNDKDGDRIKELLRALVLTYEDPTESELVALAGFPMDSNGMVELRSLINKCKPLLITTKARKDDDRVGFVNMDVKVHLKNNAADLIGMSKEEEQWQHGVLALRCFTHMSEALQRVVDAENEKKRLAEEKAKQEALEAEKKAEESKKISSELPMDGQENGAAAAEQGEQTNTDQTPQQDPSSEEAAATENNDDHQQDEDSDEEDEDDDDDDDDEDEEDSDDYSSDDESDDSSVASDLDEQDAGVVILEYAEKHWLHHASNATLEIADILANEDEFWKADSQLRLAWLRRYKRLTNNLDGIYTHADSLKSMTGLHVAASVGYSKLVTALLRNGHEDEREIYDYLNNTPLHLAAYFGRANTVEQLIQHEGVDVDKGKDIQADTPLQMACYRGNLRVMEKLLSRGADPNAFGSGPVINAAIQSGNPDAVKLLVEKGAVLNTKKTTKQEENADDEYDLIPPLSLAAAYSDLEIFKFLLNLGKTHLEQSEYDTALGFAAKTGRTDVLEVLLPLTINSVGARNTALSSAIDESEWSSVAYLLQNCSGLNCSKLVEEAGARSEFLDNLLEEAFTYTKGKIDPQSLNTALYKACDNEKESTVKILLEKFHADPNATGPEFGNALTASAFDGTIEIVKLLLQHGAKVNDPNGWALQEAAAEGHLDIVDILLAHGADPNAHHDRSFHGRALQAACARGWPSIVNKLLDHKADPNLGGGEYTLPLIAACHTGEAEIVKILLERGAIVESNGGRDMSTPFINASIYLYPDTLEVFLKHGADINRDDPDGDTALIVCCRVGDHVNVKWLLEHGADVTPMNKQNKDALRSAVDSEDTETIRIVVEEVSKILASFKAAQESGTLVNPKVDRQGSGLKRSPAMNQKRESSRFSLQGSRSSSRQPSYPPVEPLALHESPFEDQSVRPSFATGQDSGFFSEPEAQRELQGLGIEEQPSLDVVPPTPVAESDVHSREITSQEPVSPMVEQPPAQPLVAKALVDEPDETGTPIVEDNYVPYRAQEPAPLFSQSRAPTLPPKPDQYVPYTPPTQAAQQETQYQALPLQREVQAEPQYTAMPTQYQPPMQYQAMPAQYQSPPALPPRDALPRRKPVGSAVTSPEPDHARGLESGTPIYQSYTTSQTQSIRNDPESEAQPYGWPGPDMSSVQDQQQQEEDYDDQQQEEQNEDEAPSPLGEQDEPQYEQADGNSYGDAEEKIDGPDYDQSEEPSYDDAEEQQYAQSENQDEAEEPQYTQDTQYSQAEEPDYDQQSYTTTSAQPDYDGNAYQQSYEPYQQQGYGNRFSQQSYGGEESKTARFKKWFR